MSDVRIINDGTLVGLHPISDEAAQWVDDNVHSESWQWLGRILWVDHRMALPVIEGMADAGLVLTD